MSEVQTARCDGETHAGLSKPAAKPNSIRAPIAHSYPSQSASLTLPAHKTKIVATIGPASESPAILERMIRAGMNVARLNFSHGEFAYHRHLIEKIQSAAKAIGHPVAIMADLSGPKMRIGKLGGEKIDLKAGDRFTLTTDAIIGNQQQVSISFARLPSVVKPGDLLSLNDGYIQ